MVMTTVLRPHFRAAALLGIQRSMIRPLIAVPTSAAIPGPYPGMKSFVPGYQLGIDRDDAFPDGQTARRASGKVVGDGVDAEAVLACGRCRRHDAGRRLRSTEPDASGAARRESAGGEHPA